jgi:hypothetical protein
MNTKNKHVDTYPEILIKKLGERPKSAFNATFNSISVKLRRVCVVAGTILTHTLCLTLSAAEHHMSDTGFSSSDEEKQPSDKEKVPLVTDRFIINALMIYFIAMKSQLVVPVEISAFDHTQKQIWQGI